MFQGISPFCTQMARRHFDRLPDDCRRDGEPARWFVQEVLWSVWLELVDSMLGGPELSPTVSVGRQGLELALQVEDWVAFQVELGCDKSEVREHVGRLLWPQIKGVSAGPAGKMIPLGQPLASLMLLLCVLDQRERSGQRVTFGWEDDLATVVRRHPMPAAFGPTELLPAASVLVEYAGLSRSSRSGPLRAAYFALYKPLCRRLQKRRWMPVAAAPPDIPPGFLREVAKGARSASAPLPACPEHAEPAPSPPEPLPTLAGLREPPREVQIGLAALALLLEPVLLAEGDPLEAARAARPALGRRLCRALVQFLQGSSVEWYGRPGDRVELVLPQPDWHLDKQAAAPLNPEVPQRYRVTRRGLRLYGRVIAPALVAPDLEAPQ
jgi:hypothetical protein